MDKLELLLCDGIGEDVILGDFEDNWDDFGCGMKNDTKISKVEQGILFVHNI